MLGAVLATKSFHFVAAVGYFTASFNSPFRTRNKITLMAFSNSGTAMCPSPDLLARARRARARAKRARAVGLASRARAARASKVCCIALKPSTNTALHAPTQPSDKKVLVVAGSRALCRCSRRRTAADGSAAEAAGARRRPKRARAAAHDHSTRARGVRARRLHGHHRRVRASVEVVENTEVAVETAVTAVVRGTGQAEVAAANVSGESESTTTSDGACDEGISPAEAAITDIGGMSSYKSVFTRNLLYSGDRGESSPRFEQSSTPPTPQPPTSSGLLPCWGVCGVHELATAAKPAI